MSQREFVFMPTDDPNALLFASIQRSMESRLGRLMAAEVSMVWNDQQQAVREVLALLYSVDLAMAVAGKDFPDSTEVKTMLTQWALSSPMVHDYLTSLASTPRKVNRTEMAHWFVFLTIRRQTLELNDINVPWSDESPISQV